MLALRQEERPALYRDEAWRRHARADMQRKFGARWNRISVQESNRHQDIVDRPMSELAVERGADPLDVMVDIALAEDLTTRFRFVLANDDETDLANVLCDDRSLLGLSDAGAHASQLCDAVFSTYLLEHWVRETGTLTLEQAVWRLTGHPASVFGIADRGRLAPGMVADLVAFDPATVGVAPLERVHDLPAGADRLVARSRGIHHVWVNGTPIVSDRADVPGQPGKLLR